MDTSFQLHGIVSAIEAEELMRQLEEVCLESLGVMVVHIRWGEGNNKTISMRRDDD